MLQALVVVGCVAVVGLLWWWSSRRRADLKALAGHESLPQSGRQARPEVGDNVGAWRLQEKLGSGGTAVVFRARCAQGDVALKVILLSDPMDPLHFVQRFQREVEILKQLDHPGIVRFLAAGEDRGRLYLVEELAPQGTLRRLMPPEGLPPPRFLHLFLAMAEAVAYAHSKGVVHRDLKPENIVLQDDDHLKITDFGLARSELLGAFTTTATTLGTPTYMAPEQCAGRVATAAADQYSLGIIGYEMLIGNTPFFGPNLVEIMIQHMYELPAPLSTMLKHPVPPAFETVLMRMLAKNPEDRFASVDEAIAALRHGG